MLRVLLTNDDGIDTDGLHSVRRALLGLGDVDVVTIAPNQNQTAVGRGITIRRPLMVERVDFDDGTSGYATDGTPVDCVRLASLGLVEGFTPDLVVSGINHGSNLGDDVTYSGTVAAAFEGVLLGVPGIAISQQSVRGEMGFRDGKEFDFTYGARFTARLVEALEDVPLAADTLLNVNIPAGEPAGVEVCRLGKRIYHDQLHLHEEEGERRRFWVYGSEPTFEREEGTDLLAVSEGRIAITPLHLDLTHEHSIGPLTEHDLSRLLERSTP